MDKVTIKDRLAAAFIGSASRPIFAAKNGLDHLTARFLSTVGAVYGAAHGLKENPNGTLIEPQLPTTESDGDSNTTNYTLDA